MVTIEDGIVYNLTVRWTIMETQSRLDRMENV